MRRWLDPGWYRYLLSMYPDRAAVVLIIALGAIAFGGYAAVSALGRGDKPATTHAFVPLTTTVMRTVKAYEQGHVVVKRVAVVKKVAARPVAVQQTSTIKTPGGTTVVTTSRYRTVKDLVTTKLTRERTSTLTQSETQTATATVTRTATAPPDTVTVAGPTTTLTVTDHVTTTVTATLPAVTVTVTVTTPKGP